MYTEDKLTDKGNRTEIIKDLHEVLSRISFAVFFYYLNIKTIDITNLSWFMIASDYGDEGGVLDFETQNVWDGLH